MSPQIKILIMIFTLYRFVEPPVLDMSSVVEDSTTRSPLIFVLSPGVVSQTSSCFVKVVFGSDS
jgi:hypothetical protein